MERIEPGLLPLPPTDSLNNPFEAPKSRVAAPEARKGLYPHQKAGRIVRLMAWIGALGAAAMIAALLIPTVADDKPLPVEMIFVCLGISALIATQFFIAYAILAHRGWGRVAGIILGLFYLPGIPLGTIVGLYVLWQLIGGWHEYPE